MDMQCVYTDVGTPLQGRHILCAAACLSFLLYPLVKQITIVVRIFTFDENLCCTDFHI